MKYSLSTLVLALSLLSCDSTEPNAANERPVTFSNDYTAVGAQSALAGFTVVVSPSGDASGVTDANNIQDALNNVKESGGTVYLTDGDATTADDYYTSRNIVVESFSGTLKGEGMNNTIIHAGRQSPTIGFAPAFAPWWSSPSAILELPTVLQFSVPSGGVTIRDLAIEVKDDQPTDPLPDFYGNLSTYITTLIEILGGEHDTRIENVRAEGKETGAAGNRFGMNVDVAIHVMLGVTRTPPPAGFGTGDLRVKNVETANVSGGGVLFMRYQNGSMIEIDDLRASNVGRGIWGEWVLDSSVKISNSDIVLRAGGNAAIVVFQMPSGAEITGNTITGSGVEWGVHALFTDNAVITGNTIKDLGIIDSWRAAAIRLWSSHDNSISGNDFQAVSGAPGIALQGGSSGNTLDHNIFVKSGLPGWTATTPDGPGAIRLDVGTRDNYIHEMQFPAGTGKTLCEMIWDMTDDPETTDYDGANEVHNWQPCENLAERVAQKSEPESRLGFDGRY